MNQPIPTLFDRLDDWRHLPKYQLERRADIFFSLYLPEVLAQKLETPMHPLLAPEFPVNKATLSAAHKVNDSFNIDYLAVSMAKDRCVFVELKTDMASRKEKQDEYLLAAQKVGLPALLEGVVRLNPSRSPRSRAAHHRSA